MTKILYIAVFIYLTLTTSSLIYLCFSSKKNKLSAPQQ